MSKSKYEIGQEIAKLDEETTKLFAQEEAIRTKSRINKEKLRQAIAYEQMNETFLLKEIHKKIMDNREKMNKLIPYKELFQLKENEEELTERLSQELTLEERIEIGSKLEWYKSLIKKFKNEIQIIESDISSSSSSSSSSGSLSSSSSSYGSSTSSESSSAASSESFSSSSSYGSSSTSEEVQDLGSTAQETSDIWHC